MFHKNKLPKQTVSVTATIHENGHTAKHISEYHITTFTELTTLLNSFEKVVSEDKEKNRTHDYEIVIHGRIDGKNFKNETFKSLKELHDFLQTHTAKHESHRGLKMGFISPLL